jgi:phage terminase large subunit-like protein
MADRSTACPDWHSRLREGRSIIPPPLYPDQAEAALRVFKELRIVDAPGSPTFGESSAPWVFDLVASVFGAYNVQTGRREITEWFVLIPKKNSKSTLAAGIMMTALVLNWRESGAFNILAPTVEVAGNSFGPAADMVRKDDDLGDLMHVQTHIKTITHRVNRGFLKVLAADENTVGGTKGVGNLVDELHLFGKMSGAENMLREALGGLASRPEGFVIYLTTQSDQPPAGVFKQKLQYARDVRDGKIHDPGFVPVIFEHPPDMVEAKEHLLLDNLAMVNPNIGYSVDRAFLEREFTKAEQAGEASFRGFMAKHGNVEIGLALRSDRWAGADHWDQQTRLGSIRQGSVKSLKCLLECSEVATVGIDGGGLDDLLGLAVVGRHRDTHDWLVWTHAWAHPSVLQRHKQEAARFRDFERDGDLTIVERIGQDVDAVADICAQIEAAELLDKIGVDPHGLGGILDGLMARDIPEDKIVGISQGWKLTGSIKTAERKLAEGAIIHGNQPLMAWCVGNAKVEPRGNAVTITKQSAGNAKIDPLMAFFNAVSLMSLNPESRGSFMDFISNPVRA